MSSVENASQLVDQIVSLKDKDLHSSGVAAEVQGIKRHFEQSGVLTVQNLTSGTQQEARVLYCIWILMQVIEGSCMREQQLQRDLEPRRINKPWVRQVKLSRQLNPRPYHLLRNMQRQQRVRWLSS